MKVEEGCIRYQKGHCTDCYPPFKLKGTSCSIEGCIEMESGKCEKCEEPYILSEDKCVIENCL